MTNADPTVCINDLVAQHNASRGTKLAPFSVEELLARTVNNIERLVACFQDEGRDGFVRQYYERWLHRWASVVSRDVLS